MNDTLEYIKKNSRLLWSMTKERSGTEIECRIVGGGKLIILEIYVSGGFDVFYQSSKMKTEDVVEEFNKFKDEEN